MYKISPHRLKAVEHYLKSGETLHQTARKFNVHYQSVYKWVKKYRTGGMEELTNTYKRPWNRISPSLEKEIVGMKERDPALTVRKAQAALQDRSIHISLKGIWQVWTRYGHAGFDKTRLSSDFLDYYPWTVEGRHRYQQAQYFYDRGEVKKAAKILNSLPILPHNSLLPLIPESLCNLVRRVERSISLFGKTPLPAYLKKVKALYAESETKNMHLTALRTGIAEVIALSWRMDPDQQLKRTHDLQKKLQVNNGYYSNLLFIPSVILMVSEGISCAHRSEISKAQKIAQQCRRRLLRRTILSNEFMILIGTLYNQLENYQEAGKWFHRALDLAPEETKGSISVRLAEIYFLQGEYDKALALLRKGKTQGWIHRTRRYFYRAMRSFMKGMPNQSIQLASEALSITRREGLYWDLLKAYNAIASAYLSLGETKKAMRAIRRLVSYSRKLKRAEKAFEILLSSDKTIRAMKLSQNMFPTTRLALLLRLGHYNRAHRLARQKGMMAYLHRFIFYVPSTIRKLIEAGRDTGLPRNVLRLPIFNRNALVYNIRFMGKLVIYRNHQYVRHQLQPKDTALLIHICLRMREPGTHVRSIQVCDNFWKHTKKPEQNLYHALIRIKKALRLPTHLLTLHRRHGESVVMNHGIYFMSDFAECEQLLSTASAFARAGEWIFAQNEYTRARRLLRGQPFQKMYDPWSEHTRLVILNKLETSRTNFVKLCPPDVISKKILHP